MFTQEELIALKNLVIVAGGYVGLSDEPLINIVYEKLERLITEE